MKLPNLPGAVAYELICRAVFVLIASSVVLWIVMTRVYVAPFAALTMAALVSAYDFTRFVLSHRGEEKKDGHAGLDAIGMLAALALVVCICWPRAPRFHQTEQTRFILAHLESIYDCHDADRMRR